MFSKTVSSAARCTRHHEIDEQAGIIYKEIDYSEKKSKTKSDRGKSTAMSFILRGSQRTSSQINHSGEDISFRQHLPPIELREEEYVLSALMANSR
jgi:hypothetical protein